MKKSAIILDESMPQGLMVNSAACILSGLFNGEEDVLGPQIEGEDCTFIPITKIPILILKRGDREFTELLDRAKSLGLKYMLFTKEGQSTTSYEEYVERVTGASVADLTIVGLGVIGDADTVKKCVGDLPLLR